MLGYPGTLQVSFCLWPTAVSGPQGLPIGIPEVPREGAQGRPSGSGPDRTHYTLCVLCAPCHQTWAPCHQTGAPGPWEALGAPGALGPMGPGPNYRFVGPNYRFVGPVGGRGSGRPFPRSGACVGLSLLCTSLYSLCGAYSTCPSSVSVAVQVLAISLSTSPILVTTGCVISGTLGP